MDRFPRAWRPQAYRSSNRRLVGPGVVDAAPLALVALALAAHGRADPAVALPAHVRVDVLPVAILRDLAGRPRAPCRPCRLAPMGRPGAPEVPDAEGLTSCGVLETAPQPAEGGRGPTSA